MYRKEPQAIGSHFDGDNEGNILFCFYFIYLLIIFILLPKKDGPFEWLLKYTKHILEVYPPFYFIFHSHLNLNGHSFGHKAPLSDQEGLWSG